MKIAVIGGTGRIGSLVVRAAMTTGHEVTSLAGHPSSELGVRSVVGDIRARDVMQQALFGAEAVIAAVGPRGNHPAEVVALEQGMRNLVMVATELGVNRLVLLSGAAVDVTGDRKPVLDRLASAVVRRAARHVVEAKQREFEVVSAVGARLDSASAAARVGRPRARISSRSAATTRRPGHP